MIFYVHLLLINLVIIVVALAEAPNCTDDNDWSSSYRTENYDFRGSAAQTCKTPDLNCKLIFGSLPEFLINERAVYAYSACCQCKPECDDRCDMKPSRYQLHLAPTSTTAMSSRSTSRVDPRIYFLFFVFSIVFALKCFANGGFISNGNGSEQHTDFDMTLAERSDREREKKLENKNKRESLINASFFKKKLEDNDSVRFFGVIKKDNKNDESKNNDDSGSNNDAGKKDEENNCSDEEIDIKEERYRFNFTERPDCSICLEVYKTGDTVCWAKIDDCDHIFHKECIHDWLKNHDECPLCRVNVLTDSTDSTV